MTQRIEIGVDRRGSAMRMLLGVALAVALAPCCGATTVQAADHPQLAIAPLDAEPARGYRNDLAY